MKIHTVVLFSTLCMAGCAAEVPLNPKQGLIPAPSGGATGYQHGSEGSRFVLGDHVRRDFKYGYLRRVGDEGTVAINQSNGSVFGVPNAQAKDLRLPPFGASPQDHDAFVRDYFSKLGIAADQIGGVRGMTLLEASGRSDETTRTVPKVTAYYSVLQRTVGGVPVPDSFAWARVNFEGNVVAEAVYWPPLSGDVVAETSRFKELLSDPERRRSLESRIPVPASQGVLTIRHASATEEHFEAFASFDVTVHLSPAPSRPTNAHGQVVSTGEGTALVRHFDVNGVERFLPQETLQLRGEFPERKSAAP